MHVTRINHRFGAAAEECGFTVLLALFVLMITSLLLGATYVAVLSDTGPSRNALDQKRAFAAAQGGISQYTYDLNQDPNFWDTCYQSSTPVPVGATDQGSSETYSIKPVAATGYSSCSTTNPINSMIESSGAAAGTFRIASTGTSNGITRTLVAQYTRSSFLSYVYFTNFEVEDPQWSPGESAPGVNCAVYAWANGGRNSACNSIAFGTADAVNGPLHSNDNVLICNPPGAPAVFGRSGQSPPDSIESPNVLAESGGCGGTFTVNGTENHSVGTLQPPPNDTQLLQLADGQNPANSNGCYTGAGCVFTGPTTIVLDGPISTSNQQNRITVTNSSYGSPAGTPTTVNFPDNGVIYVNAGASCNYAYTPYGTENQLYGGTTLDPNSSDTANAGCGDAVVSGSTSASTCLGTTQVAGVCPYTQSLTIGAANDIIIAGSVTTTHMASGCPGGESGGCPTGTALLGLIANNNVRVFHPLGSAPVQPPAEGYCLASSPSTGGWLNTNGAGSLINPTIDAAIFAVNDSFIIDAFDCGASSDTGGNTALGTLTINGTIAQNFRGRVAEGNPQVAGYVKNYWYDQRLATIEPPFFLDPVGTNWTATRVTECNGSTAC
jgi:Tfp pilus assembly protein PilX